MNETDGKVQIFVAVVVDHFTGGTIERLKMIEQKGGVTKKEAEHYLIEFCKKNPNLPVIRATWTPYPEDLSLNFTSRK